ncbi:MAG: rhomboid family intramembrane serine protease, partial [Verrucomicrobiota bacterium]
MSDRDYMRDGGGGSSLLKLTPALIWWMIGINVVVFLLPEFTGWQRNSFGGCSWEALQKGQIWTLLTYQFLHGSILHLVMNMLGLFFLGSHVHRRLGDISFLLLYLTGGIAAAFFELGISLLSSKTVNLIGASGSVLAVVAAFVSFHPQQRLQIFPLPFLIPAIRLFWGYV